MVSYCLFCNTNRCVQIASEIHKQFGLMAFSPKIIQRKWVKGKCYEETNSYLPGYVFLYSDIPIQAFREIKQIDGVLRFLGEKETGYVLYENDHRFAEMILANHGQIGIFKAYEIGNHVYLTKESLAGMEGEIVKLDRRKGRAQVEFQFDSRSFKIWVGFDLMTDTKTES